MKRILLALVTVFITLTSQAQMVATMEIKEPIPGLCNPTTVYVLMPMFDGNKEAICPLSDNEINKKVNEECKYLQENPDFDGKGMMNLIINCKGEMLQSWTGNTTGTEELDDQLAEIFKNLGSWKPGKLKGKKVDSTLLFSFTIKNGKFTLN